jgi:hypothetical protein
LTSSSPVLSEVPALAESPNPPRTHLHLRGDFRNPGIEVEPGTLAVLPPLPENTRPDRLALARWIASAENPLTPRVAVNRVFQELFGKGLAPTSDDFGKRGDPPSHPELLDWLAAEFVENKWNFKAIIKTIALSSTYRQSSRTREDLRLRDPGNQLLARQVRLRLPAELIRDNALTVSGLLNPAIGGKSVRPPMPASSLQVAYRAKWDESQGADRYRRGLYTFLQRSVPYPQLNAFDAPSSLVSCSRRERSTTPSQALNLLNDPVFWEAAQGLAARVLREAPGPLEERIRYLFELSLGRSPASDEVRMISQYYNRKRLREEANPQAGAQQFPGSAALNVASGEAAAWVGAASIVLNLDEFITRE